MRNSTRGPAEKRRAAAKATFIMARVPNVLSVSTEAKVTVAAELGVRLLKGDALAPAFTLAPEGRAA
jgi:hypothetical protein